MILPPLNAQDIDACRALQKKHGTSYFFATKFLPREKHWAVHALYAFFRVADEIVDTAQGLDEAAITDRLQAFEASWRATRAGVPTTDPVLRLTHRAFEQFSIPDAEAEAFLHSMEMDIRVTEYQTYEDVRQYMYGSAAVVGRMMTYVLGYTDEAAFARAEALGYAMQWTNFLRDINEDWQERKRVYVPQDRLRAHGLSTQDIAEQRFSPAFARFMTEEIARADALYAEAELGMMQLATGHVGVRIASRLYQSILRRLEAHERNPFLGRVRTNLAQKIWIAAKTVIADRYGASESKVLSRI